MSVTKYNLDKRVFKGTGVSFVNMKNQLDLQEYIEDVISDADANLTLAGTYSVSGSLKANTISERTAANGVAVDGVTLKDGGVKMSTGTVTQLVSITTGVTIDKPTGIITTVSSTLAAGAFAKFTVTNSTYVNSASVILCNICNYTGAIDGSNGQPEVFIDNIGDGTFDMVLFNSDATQALSGTVSIAFAIVA